VESGLPLAAYRLGTLYIAQSNWPSNSLCSPGKMVRCPIGSLGSVYAAQPVVAADRGIIAPVQQALSLDQQAQNMIRASLATSEQFLQQGKA
jgi:hypothetical protein